MDLFKIGQVLLLSEEFEEAACCFGEAIVSSKVIINVFVMIGIHSPGMNPSVYSCFRRKAQEIPGTTSSEHSASDK